MTKNITKQSIRLRKCYQIQENIREKIKEKKICLKTFPERNFDMKLTSVTDKKINELFKVLVNVHPDKIVRNIENDTIDCTFTTIWKDDNGEFPITDDVTLTKNGLEDSHFPFDLEDKYTYNQWLVAIHRHPLFDNNPFINNATLQKD